MTLRSSKTSHALLDTEDASSIDFRDYSFPYITGHGFALRCGRWWYEGMKSLGKNPGVHNECVFVKQDHLAAFFDTGLVPDSFVLVTHNSDFIVDVGYRRFLNDARIRLWLTMNKGIDHPKLVGIPDGIQNYVSGGKVEVFEEIRKLHLPKQTLFYANFTIDSNINHRAACAAMFQPQGVSLSGRCLLKQYLTGMAEAMFTFAPNGSGIDSCRTYEALYMRSIPVVLRTPLVEEFPQFPVVALDRWDEAAFKAAGFSEQLYERLWSGWADKREAWIDQFCRRLNGKYGVGLPEVV